MSTDPTMFRLTCLNGGDATVCYYGWAARVEPGTYLYDVTAIGRTQRVSLVIETTHDTCCSYTAGELLVVFRDDAGP